MKINEAMDIIEQGEKGFMVSFQKHEGGLLASDHFPDKHAGEELIENEEEAWELAERFAKATDPNVYSNIYVIDKNFSPVKGYANKKLRKY